MQDGQTWPLIAVNVVFGVACAAFLTVVAWAVAHDLLVRWRTRGRMPDAWPPEAAGPGRQAQADTPVRPVPEEGGARC